MDFEDMNSLQIEDLGRFLSEHMPDQGTEDWKGFSLGYADDDGNSPTADSSMYATAAPMSHEAVAQKSFHSLMSSSLPNSPFPGAVLSRQALDSAMSEFNDFSLEDKVKKSARALPSAYAQPSSESAVSQVMQSWAPPEPPAEHAPAVQPPMSMKRPFTMMVSCDSASCGTIGSVAGADDEDDRGYRKKSREKMRRQEVNVKFDELTYLLGMNDKVRKSAVLQEAISTIKNLQRERDELRLDRDRMKQEVSKLASCLQFSHMGSMVAANAMAMTQMPQQQAHPQYPVGSAFGMNFHPYGHMPAPPPPLASAPITPTTVCPPIAPKLEIKPTKSA
ncbi:Aste57867_22439 [Aphanomyces stellatus]|uniref:Aste57867_22439 protein n=1 Tax=Aphanomyces stellatus TaxID=120398 RepID=A0A485LLL0_9STRA|nr:hypothetical protein As57867_022369 [Aphanomyces stellatus]VFT99099.1 Aste57867_22439 [Aphanomyces stellatus]